LNLEEYKLGELSLVLNKNFIKIIFSTLIISGCSVLAVHQYDDEYGKQRPINRLTENINKINAWKEAKEILDDRCVVCHGCYDAPCQLNLASFEGIERGANKEKVYTTRLQAAEPGRLFEDAFTVKQWRDKKYFPVLNERNQTPEANISAGLMARMLTMKAPETPPHSGLLPDSISISLKRAQQCPTIEEFDHFEKNYPSWGMPYGLPALSNREYGSLISWIQQGAPNYQSEELSKTLAKQVSQWEEFLNGNSLKHQLMSRYLYEHLFVNHIYFNNDISNQVFFKLVRSRTNSGNEIDLIATRRPYDAPDVERVYYRLQPVISTILDKTHIAYPLNNERMQLFEKLFINAKFEVDSLPAYDPVESANPFITFKDIPVDSRYRFLLLEAKSTISGFIKGAVCRGQIALSVINDRFWVYFINPESKFEKNISKFLVAESKQLSLPTDEGSNNLNLLSWIEYASIQKEYLKNKGEFIRESVSQNEENDKALALDVIWNGDAENDNAALTVFRHMDSATVVKGLVGSAPKTAWVIGYTLLERIHYLLVAGFDVYGNVDHQLKSRLFMDFLRMEGEYNFLTLLPVDARKAERDYWYRGAHAYVSDYINWTQENPVIESDINFKTKDHKIELFDMLNKRLADVLDSSHSLDFVENEKIKMELIKLSKLEGQKVSYLPEISFIYIIDSGKKDKVFSIARDNAYNNISHLLSEKTERLKNEDKLTVVRGFIGSYPNVFLKLKVSELPDFVETIKAFSSEEDYKNFLDEYGVRRTDPEFWTYSDNIFHEYQKNNPVNAGRFDLSRLENR